MDGIATHDRGRILRVGQESYRLGIALMPPSLEAPRNLGNMTGKKNKRRPNDQKRAPRELQDRAGNFAQASREDAITEDFSPLLQSEDIDPLGMDKGERRNLPSSSAVSEE